MYIRLICKLYVGFKEYKLLVFLCTRIIIDNCPNHLDKSETSGGNIIYL